MSVVQLEHLLEPPKERESGDLLEQQSESQKEQQLDDLLERPLEAQFSVFREVCVWQQECMDASSL